MPFRKTYFLVFLVALGFSCSKKSDKDRSLPTVTLINPVNHQQYTAGETIFIDATAADNDKVSEMHIHVKNKQNDALLRDIHALPDNANGSIHDNFPAQAGITYIIEVIAKDPAQNFSSIKVEVSVN